MSLRNCFLQWVSKIFDVAIITSTQHILKPEIAVGRIYLLKTSDNPFSPLVQSKILDIKNGYVQYCFLREDETEMSLKWSERVDMFKRVYIEKRYELRGGKHVR
jgi:hypothetical protein